MTRAVLTFCFLSACMSLPSQAQQTAPAPSPSSATEKKANARPDVRPAATKEAFEDADVKAMASKCVKLETEQGDIEIELYPGSAPETVRNFLNLTAMGAFDATTFSRVVPGFVIQGGNIWTRNDGVPQELAARARRHIPDEPNKILHERGVVSMARTDDANSASSNFFILVSAASYLDGKFAAFGRVIKGMEVVDTINKAPVDGEKPQKPVRVKKASVFTCVQ